MEIDVSIRQAYRLMRNQKKMKLKDIAEIIGVSIPMLSMYENEVVNLSQEKEWKYRELIASNEMITEED